MSAPDGQSTPTTPTISAVAPASAESSSSGRQEGVQSPARRTSRDIGYWAKRITRLRAPKTPAGTIDPGLEGSLLSGPLQGFGPMWKKTYRIKLTDCQVSPREAIQQWKENFPRFWPPGHHFFAPLPRIAPGDVAVLSLDAPGPMPLSTGIMVIYADEESFTFMTPQGHMLSAWITFSAYEQDGCTVCQAEAMLRAADPLIEVGLRLFGHRQEDKLWKHTLHSLARHLGANGEWQMEAVVLDPRLQWSQVWNVRYNPMIRSFTHMVLIPVRLVRRRSARRTR